MSFISYDIMFLIIFTLFVIIFLYKRRHNLKREGILYLYKTQVGIKFIETFTNKYKKFLNSFQYVIITSGYILMFLVIYSIGKFTWFYLTSPVAAKALKVPVIMPLIPYLPELFKIDFLPPFYFTYWILIIAAIAIPHEFAHGIFARLNKIRIKSTGFGFLGPFLAAFVEQDNKQMQKASKFSQLSVLASGTFANVIAGILFALILWLFFILAFTPSGIIFNTYTFSEVNLSQISSITPIDNSTTLKIESLNKTYFVSSKLMNESLNSNLSYVFAYDDSPAYNAKIEGAITKVDNQKITNYQELNQTLLSRNPGDKVTIITFDGKAEKSYNITLDERNGKPFLGIGAFAAQRSGILGFIYNIIAKIRDPLIYYQSKIGDIGIFILDLFWWLVLVSFSVALMNMLPAGIFDGGRFFYLTILGITRNEKIAKYSFAIITWLLLFIIALMLLRWVFAIYL